MKPLSRRQFLTGAAGLGVVAGASAAGVALLDGGSSHRGRAAPPTPARAAAPAPTSAPAGKGVLVLLALYGGNDGLNTLIPYADAAYLGARPSLGYQPGEVIHLDAELALHPALTELKNLWDAKRLAIVRGVGYPDPNYSHFRSMDIWQSGAPDRDEPTGWLGRYLDTTGGKDPLWALSLGPTMPPLLQGASVAGSALPSGSLTIAPAIEQPYTAVMALAPDAVPLQQRVASSGAALLTVVHAVRDVLSAQTSPAGGTNLEGGPPSSTAPGAAGTTNGLGAQLDVVARLIGGGLPTRVYVVSFGGFDTHGTEKDTHAALLAELDAAVGAFAKAVAGHPVVLMTFSEFGRRVAQNASGGTDHGSAAPLFVVGSSVKGGYYGDQPSLTDLDSGNLRFTTDFRSVYATVAEGVLGIDQRSVLGGTAFPTLGFV
jgi:uncharacterized protein (DUF1501 family)